MERIALSKSDEWTLTDPEQDLRGRRVRTGDGEAIGTVDDLIIDTDSGYVDAIIMDDGTEYSIEELRIEREAVYLTKAQPKQRSERSEGSPQRGGQVGLVKSYADFEDDFQNHFNTTYRDREVAFKSYRPAYRFGFESAQDERFRGKDFNEAEKQLRLLYEERYPDTAWESVRAAVSHAYERARMQESYRHHYSNTYGKDAAEFATYEPAYRFGRESARDERFRGQTFGEVESELRLIFEERYPNSNWTNVQEAVRYGYEQEQHRTGDRPPQRRTEDERRGDTTGSPLGESRRESR